MKINDCKEKAKRFALDGKKNILLENDFGIVNGSITTGINYSRMFSLSGLWAPPYASSDFSLDIRFFGEKIGTCEYEWYPFMVKAAGELHGVEVTGLTSLVPGKRALVIKIQLKNTNRDSVRIPIQIITDGGMDYVHIWDFPRPFATKKMDISAEKDRVVKINNNRCMIIGTDIVNLLWFEPAGHWNTEISLSAGEENVYYLVVVLGEKHAAFHDFEQIMGEPQKAIHDARVDFENQVDDMFDRLPTFEASDERLTAYYYRSLIHYLTNKWKVPEFVLKPNYTTGSIKGGCLANYLYDFSEGWELHPMYDPDALKEHIKQFLKVDITNCFCFNSMSGAANGPWYPVNQEKIIGLIYFYVSQSGDADFLNEIINGKTILDLIVYHAKLGDDGDGPATLYDYGIDGEHHLELKRGSYHGILPDLNGRRYQNYIWAYELSQMAGKPMPLLSQRAGTIKGLLKKELWDPDEKWFCFKTGGQKLFTYTIQMYKLISSAVLDEEELEGLLSHLNEEEFFSEFGFHSISKKDPAYNQADIDNGGGGCYVSFPPQIAERLYKANLGGYAEDILKRILWWGERLPYWGDSQVSNNIDYRTDSPLQCTIGSVAGAQCIIFGMFGVEVRFDGTIVICPKPVSFSAEMSLKGLKLRGHNIDITAEGGKFRVDADGRTISAEIGTRVIIDGKNGMKCF
ncbi:MAG: hypothetical protein FIA99_05125 [Ruminiclostridium sp.]|nr:hypothetical protein [Ruminiclostridium sp.]